MTAAEEGAYHRLLCLAWSDKDCTLPADKTALLAMSKLGSDQNGSLETVLSCFEPHPTIKKRIHNARLTEEWAKAEEYHRVRSNSGAIGALKRWHSGAIAPPKHSNSILQSQSQLHKQKEVKNPDKSVVHAIPGEEEWKPIQDKLSKIVKPFPS